MLWSLLKNPLAAQMMAAPLVEVLSAAHATAISQLQQNELRRLVP